MIAWRFGFPEAQSFCVRRGALIRSGLATGCALLFSLSFVAAASAQDKDNKDKKKNPPAASKGGPVVVARHVLVFPTDTKGGVGDQVADDIASVIQSRLSLAKIYEPIAFLPSIPTVKLAVAEQTLTQADIKKPFDSDAKLKKLSGVTSYDMVFVSSIDDYQYDSAKNQVSVVMSARLIDYSGAKAVVRSAAQSATSPENGGNTPELKIATELLRTLTDKLMTAIITPKPPTK